MVTYNNSITLIWDNGSGAADIGFDDNGYIVLGNPLVTAATISLFTDALATPDFVPTDGTNDLRGCWIDSIDTPTGSNLWQYERYAISNPGNLLAQSKSFAEISLQWMIDSGIATSVVATTSLISPTMLGISVTITQPNGLVLPLPQYSYVWGSIVTPGFSAELGPLVEVNYPSLSEPVVTT